MVVAESYSFACFYTWYWWGDEWDKNRNSMDLQYPLVISHVPSWEIPELVMEASRKLGKSTSEMVESAGHVWLPEGIFW